MGPRLLKRLLSACEELKIKTTEETAVEDFLSACEERLKDIPWGEEGNHFSERVITLYNQLIDDNKPVRNMRKKGRPKEPRRYPAYCRSDSVTEVIKKAGVFLFPTEIAERADRLFIKKGGEPNFKESLFYTKIIVRTLRDLGSLEKKEGGFLYRREVVQK